MEDTISRRELAERLKVSVRTLRNWQSKGVLPAPDYSVQHVDRWRLSTVERALTAQRPSDPKVAA